MLASGLLYFIGSFLVTVTFNVARSDPLARVDAQSPEAPAYWSCYVLEWTRWNHVRTVASLATAAVKLTALSCVRLYVI